MPPTVGTKRAPALKARAESTQIGPKPRSHFCLSSKRGRRNLRSFLPLLLSQSEKNAFACSTPWIPPERPMALKSLSFFSPAHSFLGFETLLVDYYNLKTSTIRFVLKRKNSVFSFCCSPRKLVPTTPKAVSAQGKLKGEVRQGSVSTIPQETAEPSPLRKIFSLWCLVALKGTSPGLSLGP